MKCNNKHYNKYIDYSIVSSYMKADVINSNFSSCPTVYLFKLERSFPTYKAHFPFTITSVSLNSMVLCRPSGPFEEDGSVQVGDLFSLKSITSVSLLTI